MLLDTPSHSAWSESSRSYSVATRHRSRTKTARDRHLRTIGLRSKDSPLTLCVCSTPNTPITNYFRFKLLVSDKLKLYFGANRISRITQGPSTVQYEATAGQKQPPEGASGQTGYRNMAEICSIDFPTSISYSTSNTLGGLSPTVRALLRGDCQQ